MNNITFHIELDSYIKKDGKQNLQIRITQNRRSKRVSTGIAIRKEDWNTEKSEVRRSDGEYRQINNFLASKILKLKKNYLQISVLNQTTSPETLISKLSKDVTGGSFLKFANIRIVKMPSPATRKAQTSVIRKLQAYIGARDLHFLEIDYEFLLNYQRYLAKSGNKVNTVHANMKNIRAIYNEAMNSGYFQPENGSPWLRIKLRKEKSSRNKLNVKQISDFESLNLKPGLNPWHSKNIFLLSYYFQGMRTADILQLKWSNIIADRVEYTARKTGKFRSKKIIPKAMAILEHYRCNGLKPNDYIFPFLKKNNKNLYSEDQWLSVISSKNSIINNHLRVIAEKIGVKKISMHVARHSFADIAKTKTGNIFAVSEALDHSSVAITQNYLNSATVAENDALVDSVYSE